MSILEPSRWSGIVLLAWLSVAPWAHAEGATEAGLLPADAVFFAELQGFGRVIDRVRTSELVTKTIQGPAFEAAWKRPDAQKALAGKAFVEAQLGMDLWTVAQKTVGRRVAMAAYAKPKDAAGYDGVLILRSADGPALQSLRQKLEAAAYLFAGNRVKTTEFNSLTVFALDGKLFWVGKGEWLVLSSAESLVKEVATAAVAGGAKKSLAGTAEYQQAIGRIGANHLLTAYLDPKRIRELKGRVAPPKLDNFLVSVLVGGVLELASQGTPLGLTVDLEGDRLATTLTIAGNVQKLGEVFRGFFDAKGRGAAPIATPPGTLFGLTLYRDIPAIYKAREQLLQERILPEFDKFETGIANLLPGRSFAEDVLPMFGKQWQLVIAEQDYSFIQGKPGLRLPGFALILEPDRPDEAADYVQLLFQTIVFIINVQAGEKGGEPMLVSSENRGGTQISYAKFLRKPTGDRLPINFNFTPSSARVGNRLILSSSIGVCRALVDELRREGSGSDRCNASVAIYPGAIAQLLEANREFLLGRLVAQGRTPDRARLEFDTGLSLLRSLGAFRLTSRVEPEGMRIVVEANWK